MRTSPIAWVGQEEGNRWVKQNNKSTQKLLQMQKMLCKEVTPYFREKGAKPGAKVDQHDF